MKIAALFSGQGSQYPGMGVELAGAYPEAKRIYECAADILGMDLLAISDAGNEAELARTCVAQPMIFTLSVSAYTLAVDRHGKPEALAGHSLGEFAALYAAGAYGLEDGFRIIKARAAAMEEAAGSASGAMYAILGSDEGTVAAVCAEAPGFVLPVNMNLPSQTVISGETEAAAAAAGALVSRGAKAVRLGVASAFHTKMMAGAAERFREEISEISFTGTTIDFYSNLTGDKLMVEDYPSYFAKHMVSPVRFVEQVAAMARDGVTHCVEYGPKKTVAALAKKNVRGLVVSNVEDRKTLESAFEF